MKNHYKELGLSEGASERDIKKAYRKLATQYHPDKGGDAEQMRLLNEAYRILSNPERRREFNESWKAYQASGESAEEISIEAYLDVFGLPASHPFRQEHEALVREYEITPLEEERESLRRYFKPFSSDLYQLPAEYGARKFSDVFSLIQAKVELDIEHHVSLFMPEDPLSPEIAMRIFLEFLAGNYFSVSLLQIKSYLLIQIEQMEASRLYIPMLPFYKSVYDICLLADMPLNDSIHLLAAIQKITDFAKQNESITSLYLVPLFHNKYFRNLFSFALHLYWQSKEIVLTEDVFHLFDGRKETKELLEMLRSRLVHDGGNENLRRLIQYIALLFQFEKDLNEAPMPENNSSFYRERAFHILDWTPAFCDKANASVMANIFLQAGINFQMASMHETSAAVQMADEQLALKMYRTMMGLGHHSKPDTELYALTQSLRYIGAFRFKSSSLDEIIPALQQRVLSIADVFPFLNTHQPNVSVLQQENRTMHLMRCLLNAMLSILEHNRSHEEQISIDHSAVTILYQVYEACLKNWYAEEYDPDFENKMRVDLMEELLRENSWNFSDIQENIAAPWVFVDRDEAGWMRPVRSLPYIEDERFMTFRSVRGFEINYKRGNIIFSFDRWSADRPMYEKVLTTFDLQEMLERNIPGAIFSLDPIDPDKPYHPYHAMRFAPSQLCETELLNTMLLTDYVLKFLTTHQEVQGKPPYALRSVDYMLDHLPLYLRKIMDDFHAAQHSGSVHRFWIEAKEIAVKVGDVGEDGIQRIAIGELKMLVKKHRMKKDARGNLIDTGDEDEGWSIYILTQWQKEELISGGGIIHGRAIIFVQAEEEVYFWENNSVIHHGVPEKFHETRIRLYKQSREPSGKVTQTAENARLIYRVTRGITEQVGLAHHYSPEFIFAHEFTAHYDEFAQYLPEFGRLKELSRIAVLIRFLNGIRAGNQEQIQALDYLLAGATAAPAPETQAYQGYREAYTQICDHVTERLQTLRGELLYHKMLDRWQEQLRQLRRDIGELRFDTDSPEVVQACRSLCDQIARDNPDAESWRIREIVNTKKSEIASTLSETKMNNCKTQLNQLFESRLKLTILDVYRYHALIDRFLTHREIHPLAEALAQHERLEAENQIQRQFSESSLHEIRSALEGSDESASHVARGEALRQLGIFKAERERVKAGFNVIHLGEEEQPVDIEGKCYWVPASVHHEVDSHSRRRYSLFVYGGVNIQPRVNITQGGVGPLGGTSVGGGSFDRGAITHGFQSHHIISHTNVLTRDHPLLAAAGFNLQSQANRIFLPTDSSMHDTRSIHIGRHTTSSIAAVASATLLK